MENSYVVPGSLPLKGRVGERACVSAQGDSDDFLWVVEFSNNNGESYVPYKNADGDSEITGSDAREIVLASRVNRVRLVDLGAATEVFLEAGVE